MIIQIQKTQKLAMDLPANFSFCTVPKLIKDKQLQARKRLFLKKNIKKPKQWKEKIVKSQKMLEVRKCFRKELNDSCEKSHQSHET